MLNTLAFIGPQEGLIILLVVLVLFGGRKIPELMRGVGQGIGELRKGMDEGQRQLNEAIRHENEKNAAEPVASPTEKTSTAP